MRRDKMKVVLLIALMFTLALARGQNPRPCLPSRNNNAYSNFCHRHILHQNFNRSSKQDWRRYLLQNGLCHRRLQTFMEKRNQGQVEQICRGSGWRYNSYSNLCISNSPIVMYDLAVSNNNKYCQIERLARRPKHVVVACDVVDNVCRPVHFERSTRFNPDTRFGRCR